MTHLSKSIWISVVKVFSLSVLIIVPPKVQSQNLPWNCAENVNGFPYDLERSSGVWYEAVRVPPSEVPACVSVTLPDTTPNDTYNMQLDYINNVNKQWLPTTENLTFPWNEMTQRGIFNLQYGSGATSMNFVFKLVITDYENLAVICYYMNFAPTASMLKIMTRQREINATILDQIQNLANEYGFGQQLTFVEQSSRCKAPPMLMPGIALLLAALFIRRFF